LAEFAVAWNVDAELPLTAHDLRHRASQFLLKGVLVSRHPRFADTVRRDQIIGARQASDVAGENMIGAGLHHSRPSRKRSTDRDRIFLKFTIPRIWAPRPDGA